MMTRIRERLFRIRHNYTNPLDYQRARGLLLTNSIIMVAWAVWLFGSAIPSLLAGSALESEIVVTLVILPVFVYVNNRLIQRGRVNIAAGLLVAFLGISIVPAVLDGISRATVMLLILPVVSAAVLLNRRGTLFVAAIALLTLIISAATQSQITIVERYIPAETVTQDFVLVLLILGLSLAFLFIFGGSSEQIVRQALVDVDDAQAVASLGSWLGTNPSENTVLTQTVDLIRSQLGYAYAGIYLLDSADRLVRATGTGTGSVARFGSASAIQQAIRLRKPVIVTLQSEPEERAHLLPSIHSGIAIPLIHAERVIGVLDIQSATQTPFSSTDTRLLSLLADQAALALHQSRALADLQTHLQTQRATAERLEEQLLTYRQRGQQAIENAWIRYLQGRGKAALGFDIDPDNIITAASDLPQTMRATLHSGELKVETVGDEQIINVPIVFRDQILGAMSFTIPAGQEISQRQLEMAQVVSNRLALALENTRLFEQSQAQALRERKATEVGNLLLGSTDVATVLNVAAASFNEALGAVQTRIYVERDAWVESMGSGLPSEEAL